MRKFVLFLLLAARPCFGMTETSARLLGEALVQSEKDLVAIKTERRRNRDKTAFDDVTRTSGRKTAAVVRDAPTN